MRSSGSLSWRLGFAALTAVAVVLPAQAEEFAERYTGVAVTYYFGGGDAQKDTGADLSLGAMDHWIDYQQDASTMHLPVLQVPLARAGEPLLAPIEALAGAFNWLRRDRNEVTQECIDCDAADGLSLPDLGAR